MNRKSARTKKRLAVHPICKMVPSMNAEAFEMLKSDIQAHGLLEAIWIVDGKILDGRHRYKACLELGIKPAFREYTGALDPETFVLAQNLSRRHLTRQERTWFLKRVLKLHPEKSDRAIAAMVGTSPTTVASARKDSPVQSGHLPRIGRDGKSYAVKAPAVTHRAASLVSHVDFECRRVLRFISELHPNQITDAADFIFQLDSQLARLKEMLSIQGLNK